MLRFCKKNKKFSKFVGEGKIVISNKKEEIKCFLRSVS